MTNKRFLDMNGLEEYIHLAKSTIYKKVSRNEIPHMKVGSRTLFDINVIDRWLENGGRLDDELPKLPNL
jgi:excisionase family DNA binding protein